jgi:uncharacterized protein (UPF0548 family)
MSRAPGVTDQAESSRNPPVAGFAYSTLPGHPESGAEGFHVRLDPDENVRAEIRASLSGPEAEPDRRLEVLLQEQVKVGRHG